MDEFTINELLQRRGLDLHAIRLVRHDQRAFVEWRRGIAFFDHFVSYQRDDNRTPYNGASILCPFPTRFKKLYYTAIYPK
jgi:hypothetical protein